MSTLIERLVGTFYKDRKTIKLAQISLDSIVCLLSVSIAALSSNIQFTDPITLTILMTIPFTRMIINTVTGSYKKLWRYISLVEVQYIILNMIIVSSILLMLSTIFTQLSYEFIAKESATFFLLSVGLRAIRYRNKEDSNLNNSEDVKSKRVIIIGAGRASHELVHNIQRSNNAPFELIGCLDDDKKKIGAEVHGIPILDTTERLEYYLEKFNIQLLIVALPSTTEEIQQEFIRRAKRAHVNVKIIPSLQQLSSSHEIHFHKSITIDDLLDAKEFQDKTFSVGSNECKDTILITGGAGYIGLHLARKFLDAGKKVKILENFTFGKSFLPKYLDHPNCEIIQGDITNIRDVVGALHNVETIIALAAIVGDPACSLSPEETLTINYEATKTLIETANFYGVKRLVFASSCSVYGASTEDSVLDEHSTLNPVSLYAKTRIMSEDIIFNRCGKVEPVILRLSTVFGYSPRMRYDLVVNALTIRALIDGKFEVFGGKQWRPFVHCDDVAQAFFLAANAPSEAVAHEIFNLGSNDMNFTIEQIGDIVHGVIPSAEYRKSTDVDDPRNYKVSFDKIHNQLGFTKSYDILRGVREIIQNVNNHDHLKNYQNAIYSNLGTQRRRVTEHEVAST